MTLILPQFHHCDCEMCEWLNFRTFFKFPCIVWIYAWFFMHCRNHHSDSHVNHVIIHYNGVIMGAMAFEITNFTIVYSSVCSRADQRKHQSSASLAFVRRIQRRPVNSPHKGPVTRSMFRFDDVIMNKCICMRRWVSLTLFMNMSARQFVPKRHSLIIFLLIHLHEITLTVHITVTS